MNTKSKLILLLTVLILMIIGTLVFTTNLFSSGNYKFALLLVITMSIVIGILLFFIKNCYYNLKDNIPGDDERTKKIRMYAAGSSYFISLYFWILLLAFHKYFDKDDLLITGLLIMTISFYFCWIIFKRKKDID
jgi:uncharacterized membrane protein